MTPEQVEIFKAMSPAGKLELAALFYDSARRLKAQALRLQHPEWSDDYVSKRVREIFLHAAD